MAAPSGIRLPLKQSTNRMVCVQLWSRIQEPDYKLHLPPPRVDLLTRAGSMALLYAG